MQIEASGPYLPAGGTACQGRGGCRGEVRGGGKRRETGSREKVGLPGRKAGFGKACALGVGAMLAWDAHNARGRVRLQGAQGRA